MNGNFPADVNQALAYLYVKNQDLRDKSPAEVFECYTKAYDEIKQANNNLPWQR